MEMLFFEKPSVLRREKRELEKQLNIILSIVGRKVTLEGDPLDEYVAHLVLDAMSLGFTPKQALQLKNEDTTFKKIHIRDFTRRKNLQDVRSRLIGKDGKTRRTIEDIADCKVVIGTSEVGIIGTSEAIDSTIQAIINIIKGSKQANVYRYLERRNAERKKHSEGLGLKIKTRQPHSNV